MIVADIEAHVLLLNVNIVMSLFTTGRRSKQKRIQNRKICNGIYQGKADIPRKTNQRKYTKIYRLNTIFAGLDYKKKRQKRQ